MQLHLHRLLLRVKSDEIPGLHPGRRCPCFRSTVVSFSVVRTSDFAKVCPLQRVERSPIQRSRAAHVVSRVATDGGAVRVRKLACRDITCISWLVAARERGR